MDSAAATLIETLRASSIRFRAKSGPATDAAFALAEHILAADFTSFWGILPGSCDGSSSRSPQELPYRGE